MHDARAALEQGLALLALPLSDDTCARLVRYVELLAKWNRTYNLTAIRSTREMVTHHLLDSLAIIPHLPIAPGGASLADAGSGAGLPGIPIALARPELRVTLADASQKKAAFLRQATIELALGNVEVHEGRVQEWRPAARFALVVSRAFSQLAEYLRACRHLVAPGGVLAAMKGAYPAQELERLPSGTACRVIRLEVPFAAERHLVLCEAA